MFVHVHGWSLHWASHCVCVNHEYPRSRRSLKPLWSDFTYFIKQYQFIHFSGRGYMACHWNGSSHTWPNQMMDVALLIKFIVVATWEFERAKTRIECLWNATQWQLYYVILNYKCFLWTWVIIQTRGLYLNHCVFSSKGIKSKKSYQQHEWLKIKSVDHNKDTASIETHPSISLITSF